jgi:hypothetical protein
MANEKWPISWVDFKMRGNANTWDDEAAKYPSLYTISTAPKVGAVAVDNSAPYQDCSSGTCKTVDYGHVAWVTGVSGSKITISQMVWGKDGMTTKTVAASTFQRFITRKASGSLTNITVTCPSSVSENSTSAGRCTAKAYFSDNTNRDVTTAASWGDNSSYLSVSGGKLSTQSVSSDKTATVTATYTHSGISKSASARVTIKDSGCTGRCLDGKDPNATGCDVGASTVRSATGTYGKVELRWSNSCKTNWTRIVPNSSKYSTYGKIRRATDGKNYSKSGAGSIWTPMVYAPTERACASGKINGKSISETCY